MFRLVALAALLAVALGSPTLRLPHLHGRIVGGSEIDISETPYQVALLWYGSSICGGSIIGSNFVVTAAHCTEGSSASSLSIRAGSNTAGRGGQVLSVSAIFNHPNYNSRTTDYDVAVLKLNGAINFGSSALAIGLANSRPAPGTSALTSGWGTTSEGGSTSSQLRAVTVPVVSQGECRSAYGSSSITERMLCAGFPSGGRDACQGDSGGPLVANGELVGVVSWGYGCARPGYPGVYADVNNLRSFITSQLNK